MRGLTSKSGFPLKKRKTKGSKSSSFRYSLEAYKYLKKLRTQIHAVTHNSLQDFLIFFNELVARLLREGWS